MCPRRTLRGCSATAAAGRGTARPSPPPPLRRRRSRTGRDVLAAMRAGIARHILDQPEHRHVGLAEQVDRPRRVDQRQVLRGRDDHRAGRPRPSGSATTARRRCRAAGRRADSSASPQSASISLASAPVAIGPRQASAWPGETSCPSDRNLMPCAATGTSWSSSAVGFSCAAEQRRLRGSIDVGVDQPDLLARPGQRDGEVGGDRRLADPALAAADRDRPSARPATPSSQCARP